MTPIPISMREVDIQFTPSREMLLEAVREAADDLLTAVQTQKIPIDKEIYDQYMALVNAMNEIHRVPYKPKKNKND